ncbi:hypothetical protein HWI79_788 [Cryptosporidium felis]|nr:hypothetical protein HWI79_788 [Cryptosporidium felis]
MNGIEDWQDPIFDVSVPYKSLAPFAITCYQLDEDLQDLISFFSTLSSGDLSQYINETSFESSLRLLKNVLLTQPINIANKYKFISAIEESKESKGLQKYTFGNTESRHQFQEPLTKENNSFDSLENHSNIFSSNDLYTSNEQKQSSESKIAKSHFPESVIKTTHQASNICDTSETQTEDQSVLLMSFFRELEAAKLFENLESFSGILSAHSIHLKIAQDVVSDFFKVEELRLRLCSQLAALINPIILSRLSSYKNSLFCTAFTVPSSNGSITGSIEGSTSLPNPVIYKWPSNSLSIEDYRNCMAKLPLICFSEIYKLESCIENLIQVYANGQDMKELTEENIQPDECLVRVKSIDTLYNSSIDAQLDHPLFQVKSYSSNACTNFGDLIHHPLCTDIAQDSKDIERDIVYINGREYSGSNGGYERIVFILARIVELYWFNGCITPESNLDLNIEEDVKQIHKETIELCNDQDNICSHKTKYVNEVENSDSVVIATLLLHILSRTFSGGACYDKVSLLYDKPGYIVISPNSKMARPLEVLILPNVALMLSSLSFKLYEVTDNINVDTKPCYLIDTNMVSRLVPDSRLIEYIPSYSFHILSKTPINKIPESILFHLIQSANKFFSQNTLYTRVRIATESESVIDNRESDYSESQYINQYGTPDDGCEKHWEAQDDNKLIHSTNTETGACNSKCLDTDKIFEVTGDELTIITPGEAALFRMFTNIQDKEGIQHEAENFGVSNSELSSSNETNENADIESSDSEDRDRESEVNEFRQTMNILNHSYQINSIFMIENHNNNPSLGYQNACSLEKNLEHKIEPDTQNFCGSNSNFDKLSSEKPTTEHSGVSPIIEAFQANDKENNESESSALGLESDGLQNNSIPRVYFEKNTFDFKEPCSLTSNIYIASSENSSNLAVNLCNLPVDSIGAIDQENQQLALFLQSKRVISQFGIFNNIINT